MINPDSGPIALRVDPAECPCRIDVYLTLALEELSRSRVQQLIREGHARVDGETAKVSLKLQGGELLEITIPSPSAAVPQPEAIALEILYEDADVIVINKPAGMVVHPGAGVGSGTLVNALLNHCSDLSGIGGVVRPGIVHRLDRLTSGCICVAKNDLAHQSLSAQLADRSMSRVYVAWVVGGMGEPEGRIDAPLGRSPRNPTRMAVVSEGGRHAATRWRALAWAPGLTRLECHLETGRTHQIRVHLAHIGHPVVGDPEYGLSAKETRLRIPGGNPRIIQAVSKITHQLLHARQLEFIHPRTGQRMRFDAPLPADFAAFDEALTPFLFPL